MNQHEPNLPKKKGIAIVLLAYMGPYAYLMMLQDYQDPSRFGWMCLMVGCVTVLLALMARAFDVSGRRRQCVIDHVLLSVGAKHSRFALGEILRAVSAEPGAVDLCRWASGCADRRPARRPSVGPARERQEEHE
ncbi:hypothetical protein [Saccharibacillus brassicae]|uniref:Uncharacterized protein n=1 Tax=Saccharibacillus brassicae TaxID=2583377 RepID=A0A4Y6UZV4_SACBS|nr:hypothetical protein [Saccharibacillus brassicae]QDH21956.1 hypothetical protein FFV09_14590 [Saccharibacillus brassicae]